MATVKLQHVCKVFEGSVKVVDDFSLDIQDKEFIVLVGPSGCGKSTTLRMIAGLEEITSGTISIDGKTVNDVPPRDRDIAMVFQSYALYPHMTVRENMAFGLKMRRVEKSLIDQKVRRAAEVLDIIHLLGRRPKQLSGGQRQRVAVGRAIVREPKCFLFDEPLSNLDAKLRVEMRAELKRLHMDLGSTTIYVTHDQEEAMTLGDRVVVMKDGVIQQCDRALDVYHRPTNRFVAGFLGNPPMNFLSGQLELTEGRLVFDDGQGQLPVPGWAVEHLQDRAGAPVVLGIRPESMSDRSHAQFATSDNALDAEVTLVQPLGSKMDVHLKTPRHPHLVAQFDAFAGLVARQNLQVFLDMDRAHFFEPEEAGRSLVHRPGSEAEAAERRP